MAAPHAPLFRTARDVMRRDVVAVQADMPLVELARLLHDEGVSGVPVVDGDDVAIGVVSASDLLWLGDRLTAAGRARAADAGETVPETVRDVMTPDVFGVTPATSLDEVREFFARTGLHRAFVLDDARVIGVVSITDLLGLIAEHLASS